MKLKEMLDAAKTREQVKILFTMACDYITQNVDDENETKQNFLIDFEIAVATVLKEMPIYEATANWFENVKTFNE